MGLVNGLLTVKVGIPAVITTIGTAFIVRGISYSFTQGLPIYPLPPEVGIVGSWRPLGTSFTFVLVLVLVVVVQILLSRTRWGSSLFATGGNKIAAQICGINTDRVKIICFMVTSFLAGLAGMLTMSQLPRTPGDPDHRPESGTGHPRRRRHRRRQLLWGPRFRRRHLLRRYVHSAGAERIGDRRL